MPELLRRRSQNGCLLLCADLQLTVTTKVQTRTRLQMLTRRWWWWSWWWSLMNKAGGCSSLVRVGSPPSVVVVGDNYRSRH
ncbi:hypothetical protein U1Q18_038546 [Sarracenia purpurea var. burkii]